MALAQLQAPPRQTPASRQPALPFYASLTFWIVLAVLVGVAWRTARLLLQFPIWGDESFVVVNFLDTTYADLIGPLRVGQICPLTFLWAELAMFQIFGPSELVLRLLPYLAGLAALVLFWPLCRLMLSARAGALALALLAVSYYPVRHAVEVKPYSVDLLIALGLLIPAARYVLEPAKVRWLVFLTLLAPVAMASSYPAVMVAGSVSLVLLPNVLRQPGWSAKGWFLAYNVLLGGSFLAHYFLVGKAQLSPHQINPASGLNSTWQEWFPALDPFSLAWWFLKAHTGNMVAYPIGGPNFASSLTTLCCLAGIWSWWRGGNRTLLALIVCPFFLSMAAAILHKYPYGGSARLDQHLAPSICLLMGNGIVFLVQRLSPRREQQSVVLVAALLVAFGMGGLVRDLVKPYKTEAELWNRTFVESLMARVGPRDRVVIFHPAQEMRPGLEWYFRQHDDRVSWQGRIDPTHEGKLWCVHILPAKACPAPVPEVIAHSGRPWVQVDYYQSVGPPEHGYEELARVYCFELKR